MVVDCGQFGAPTVWAWNSRLDTHLAGVISETILSAHVHASANERHAEAMNYLPFGDSHSCSSADSFHYG